MPISKSGPQACSQFAVILEMLKENYDTYIIIFEYNHHDASSSFRPRLPRASPES
jgi:hypothetical protein